MNSNLNINWTNLSGNSAPKAIDILRENVDKIDWEELACNSNPDAMQLFTDHFDFDNYKSYRNYNMIWKSLSSNPNAISLLEHRPEIINWDNLAENPNPKAMELFEPNINKIGLVGLFNLSKNSNAVHLLKKYPYVIQWYWLSMNPNAIYLLEDNVDKINWQSLSCNTNSSAIELIEANPQHFKDLNWFKLSHNKNAVKFIEKHYKKHINEINWACITITPKIEWEIFNDANVKMDIYWKDLSRNPTAINILEQNINRIHWDQLAFNPNAIQLLEKNMDKFEWRNIVNSICCNPNALHIIDSSLTKGEKFSEYAYEKCAYGTAEALCMLKKHYPEFFTNCDNIVWKNIVWKNPAIFDERLGLFNFDDAYVAPVFK